MMFAALSVGSSGGGWEYVYGRCHCTIAPKKGRWCASGSVIPMAPKFLCGLRQSSYAPVQLWRRARRSDCVHQCPGRVFPAAARLRLFPPASYGYIELRGLEVADLTGKRLPVFPRVPRHAGSAPPPAVVHRSAAGDAPACCRRKATINGAGIGWRLSWGAPLPL